jgi:hypothetical protein
MREFIVAMVMCAWANCGLQIHAQEASLLPGPSSRVTVGRGSGFILLADINRDGHLDLITQHLLSSQIGLFAGDGKGHFAKFHGAPLHLSYQPGAIAISDVNNDGSPDLGVTSRDDRGEYVHILVGDGSGHFTPALGSPFTASASMKTYKPSIQFADINNDRKVDVMAANGRRNTIEILVGDGRGRFERASIVPLETGFDSHTFALGNIDGDSNLDLVAASFGRNVKPGQLAVLRGDGTGAFKEDRGSLTSVPLGFRVGTLADMNGDDHLDVVAINGAEVGVLLNQGSSKFAPDVAIRLRLEMPAFAVVAADMNRDKYADLVVATVGPTAPYISKIAVMFGHGRVFAPAPGAPFPAGPGGNNLVVGDINEDGKLDIAASSFEGDDVTILLGQ